VKNHSGHPVNQSRVTHNCVFFFHGVV